MSEMSAIYRVKQYILNLIKDGELTNGVNYLVICQLREH